MNALIISGIGLIVLFVIILVADQLLKQQRKQLKTKYGIIVTQKLCNRDISTINIKNYLKLTNTF